MSEGKKEFGFRKTRVPIELSELVTDHEGDSLGHKNQRYTVPVLCGIYIATLKFTVRIKAHHTVYEERLGMCLSYLT